MEYKKICETYYVRMDRGDEIIGNILEICHKESIPSAIEEYREWDKTINTLTISEEVLCIINVIRKSLGSVTIAQTDERHQGYRHPCLV